MATSAADLHSLPGAAVAAKATEVATEVATTATTVAEAIVPGVSQKAPESTEAKVLGIEDLVGNLAKLVPIAGQFSGVTVPIEVCTHLVFSLVGMFHHTKTLSAK